MATREKLDRKAARDASTRLSRNAQNEAVELFMECEEEELSPSQIAAHKQAEKEYFEAIHKINALKANNGQIIQNSSSSPPSTFLVNHAKSPPSPSSSPIVNSFSSTDSTVVLQQNPTVVPAQTSSQASAPVQPFPGSLIGLPRVAVPITQPQQFIIQNTLPVPAVQPTATAYKLLLDTRTGLILGTVPNDGQTIIATSGTSPASGTQYPLSSNRMHSLYGQPRRTSNKAHAVKLFEGGKDIKSVAKSMHISESGAELYLIDSFFLGQEVNYVRLSRLLKLSGDMIDRILDLLTSNPDIMLSELQQETQYTYNQIRLCIARLYRGFFWQSEEDVENQNIYSY